MLTPECPPCPGLPGTFLVLAPNALHQGKPLGKWREPIALARRTLGWPPLSSSQQRARHTASCFCICVAKGLFSKPFCLYISFNESAGNPFKSWCDFLLFLQNFPPAISSPVRLPSPVHLLHLRMVFLIVPVSYPRATLVLALFTVVSPAFRQGLCQSRCSINNHGMSDSLQCPGPGCTPPSGFHTPTPGQFCWQNSFFLERAAGNHSPGVAS